MPAKTVEQPEEIVPKALRLFLHRRLMELVGLVLLALAAVLTLALASWSVLDPSLDRAVDGPVRNWLGWPGAVVADVAIVQLGLAVIVPVAALVIWGMRWLTFRPPRRLWARFSWLVLTTLAMAGTLSFLPVPASWPLGTGLGGNLGESVAHGLSALLACRCWRPRCSPGCAHWRLPATTSSRPPQPLAKRTSRRWRPASAASPICGCD